MAGGADIGILGSSGIARTLAVLAARSGRRVRLWSPAEKPAGGGKRSEALPKSVQVTHDLEEASRDTPLLIVSVATPEIRGLIRKMGDFLTGDQIIVHTARGIEDNGDRIVRAGEMIGAESCVKKIGVIAGPYFPEEILGGQPAAMVVASAFREVIQAARSAFASGSFQLFSSSDTAGVELGRALNGIYTVAGGIGEGLGYGTITRSFIISRGLAEMARFGAVGGAKAATFSGLSGLGDLIANLTQERSAAFRLGCRLGKGEKISKASWDDEDVRDLPNTIRAAASFTKRLRVSMPLLFSVYNIIEGKRTAKASVEKLMSGEAGQESEFTFDQSLKDLPIPATKPQGGLGKA